MDQDPFIDGQTIGIKPVSRRVTGAETPVAAKAKRSLDSFSVLVIATLAFTIPASVIGYIAPETVEQQMEAAAPSIGLRGSLDLNMATR